MFERKPADFQCTVLLNCETKTTTKCFMSMRYSFRCDSNFGREQLCKLINQFLR